ncbi:unnamed protein product [Chondrus crispus]|uniref:Uncharacterized protein n=1 Tax=Chondrus crispus TaxID=2769 RepID=R7QT94_CHOCR|nr:unnamed protein product [Chondrus crispus]CDF41349.1 unnamed protein product [Chondrus crispus]|eukprot:XP_005711643.1 unnamed protein product [Chondrus crispus]
MGPRRAPNFGVRRTVPPSGPRKRDRMRGRDTSRLMAESNRPRFLIISTSIFCLPCRHPMRTSAPARTSLLFPSRNAAQADMA